MDVDFLEDELVNGVAQTVPCTLKMLTTAWVNEKYAPELLKHVTEMVDEMMVQLEEMDRNLQTLSREDFRIIPHQMEVNRIRFILASYHRCRLEKIETFAAHLLKRDASCRSHQDKLMSPGEFDFAEKFLSIQKDYFMEEAYRYMPDTLIQDDPSMEIAPNLDDSVFIRMMKKVDDIIVDDETLTLDVNTRHLIPYSKASHLIKNGSAILL